MFSKRHYQRVSPPADTVEAIRERQRHNKALELARNDRTTRYPTLDPANAAEVLAYQEQRFRFHYEATA